MKIKFFNSDDPDVARIQDVDQFYERIQELDKIFGTCTPRELNQQKCIQFFELMKAQGRITSYEII